MDSMTENAAQTLILFRVDRLGFAVGATEMDSIIVPPQKVTHPPGSDSERPGIFEHAGHVHQLVDLRGQLGLDLEKRPVGRLLLHHDGLRYYGLRVDEVIGLYDADRGRWVTLPPYLPRTIFPRGFLFKERIFLNSSLLQLLKLHDHGPLRRHLDELIAAEAPSSGKPRDAAAPNPSAKERTDSTPQQQPPPSPATKATTMASTERKAAPAAATRPSTSASPRHKPAAPSKPAFATNKPATPSFKKPSPAPTKPLAPATSPASGSRTAAASAAYHRPKPAAPTVTAVSSRTAAPTRESATPTTMSPSPERGDSISAATTSTFPAGALIALLLLLLSLLVGGLYWFMLAEPQRATPGIAAIESARTVSTPRPQPPSRPSVPEVPVEAATPPPPIAEAAAEATPTPGPEPTSAIDESATIKTAETGADHSLSIRRDGNTITVEVDGEALQIRDDVLARAIDTPQTAPTPESSPDADDALDPALVETAEKLLPEQPHYTPKPEPMLTDALAQSPPESSQEKKTASPSSAPRPTEPKSDSGSRNNCPGCRFEYIVVKGDTLWDIAKRFFRNALKFKQLAEASGIKNPDLIYPGDRIIIQVR